MPESTSMARVVPSAEKEWQLPHTGSFSSTIGGGSLGGDRPEPPADVRGRVLDGRQERQVHLPKEQGGFHGVRGRADRHGGVGDHAGGLTRIDAPNRDGDLLLPRTLLDGLPGVIRRRPFLRGSCGNPAVRLAGSGTGPATSSPRGFRRASGRWGRRCRAETGPCRADTRSGWGGAARLSPDAAAV